MNVITEGRGGGSGGGGESRVSKLYPTPIVNPTAAPATNKTLPLMNRWTIKNPKTRVTAFLIEFLMLTATEELEQH